MKKNTIYSLIGVAIIVGGGLLSIYTFFGSFNPFYVVVSGSMVPKINIGDIVIIKNNSFETSFNNLRVGFPHFCPHFSHILMHITNNSS